MNASLDSVKWLATVIISVATGVSGAVWYFSGIIHRIDELEKNSEIDRSNQLAIYKGITADTGLAGPGNWILNAGRGATCDPGWAIAQLGISQEKTDRATVYCVRVRPQIEGFKQR